VPPTGGGKEKPTVVFDGNTIILTLKEGGGRRGRRLQKRALSRFLNPHKKTFPKKGKGKNSPKREEGVPIVKKENTTPKRRTSRREKPFL